MLSVNRSVYFDNDGSLKLIKSSFYISHELIFNTSYTHMAHRKGKYSELPTLIIYVKEDVEYF